MLGGRRRRREEELAAKDRWRVARRLVDEDVTVLGEQLAELHLDTLADARYHRAAVLALRDGEPLPQRREPCFFDPRHGPAMQDVDWAPPGGTARSVAVCAADARRLPAGEQPLERLVRIGDRWVPWHLTGGVVGTIDATARLAQGASHGVHGQQNLAQAHLNRAVDGANGAGYMGS